MSLPEDVPLEDVTGLRKRQALALGARVRVRQLAVVGAALVAAWAGGTGIAQAGEDAASLPPICDEITTAGHDGGELPCVPVDEEPGCEAPPYTVASESDPVSEEPCGHEVTVVVTASGDCKDPGTYTFSVDASGLDENTSYLLVIESDSFSDPDPEVEPVIELHLESNGEGVIDEDVTGTETDASQIPTTGFTFDYSLFADEEYGDYLGGGSYVVPACPVQEPVVTQPVGTVPAQPAPAPVAAPVVVHPAAAAPAVLANTGSPVTTAALLGGGLLVAGAGALVATRRRAS